MLSLYRSALLAAALLLLPAIALCAKHETWVEVRSPHFIVVSNAGEKQARKIAVQFEQVRSLFRGLITIAKDAPSPLPDDAKGQSVKIESVEVLEPGSE